MVLRIISHFMSPPPRLRRETSPVFQILTVEARGTWPLPPSTRLLAHPPTPDVTFLFPQSPHKSTRPMCSSPKCCRDPRASVQPGPLEDLQVPLSSSEGTGSFRPGTPFPLRPLQDLHVPALRGVGAGTASPRAAVSSGPLQDLSYRTRI